MRKPWKTELDRAAEAGREHAAMVFIGNVDTEAEGNAFIRALPNLDNAYSVEVWRFPATFHLSERICVYTSPGAEAFVKPLFEAFVSGLRA